MPSTTSGSTFRFGSAAIFWAALALCIWLFFYIGMIRERDEVRWFWAWYCSKPALCVALVAILIQNLWDYSGGTRRESSIATWVITVPLFAFVAYWFTLSLFFP